MTISWWQAIMAAAATLAPSGGGAADGAPDRFARAGVYVAARDVAASSAFYARVFDRQPTTRTATFVGFTIGGGLFAIASRAAFTSGAVGHGAVVPYIQVRDIDAEFARIGKVAPRSLQGRAVIREGPISLFKIVDPDGNPVEFFALGPPPAG